MHRSLEDLANNRFDLLIVGGGITGACIARDAARRGLSVALVEKNDFASATSAFNSKLIHGGLRYLKNFELGLVREALRERRYWQRTAPHLVQPLPFLVPMINAGLVERATLEIGLTLYDLLSYDRGRLDDPFQQLPGHSWLNARKAAETEPVLAGNGLEGAFVYYDAQMYSPERLALECVIDAVAHGAVAANHVEALHLLMDKPGRVSGCSVSDVFTGAHLDVRAAQTLVAAGPWSDLFLERASGRPSSHKLLRSKGIHVLVPPRTGRYALTMAAGDTHFFVLPWRGQTLLGTTDTAFSGSPDDVNVQKRDIDEFFAFMNRYLPQLKLTADDCEYAYAGLRPLVDDGSGNTYGASRRAEIVNHGRDDGLHGLISVIGGKWTSSRHLAEKVVDLVARACGKKTAPCSTASAPLPGGDIPSVRKFGAAQKAQRPGMPALDHLLRLYGTRVSNVLELADSAPKLMESVGRSGDILAQVLHAVRSEMALTLEDVVLRRTGIGQTGQPEEPVLDRISALMSEELAWSVQRRRAEVDSLQRKFSVLS